MRPSWKRRLTTSPSSTSSGARSVSRPHFWRRRRGFRARQSSLFRREGPGESQGENRVSGETGSSGESPSGEPRKLDLDKMHAYRDAIRGEGDQRVVQYAAILYPGRTRRFSAGMEAIGIRPGWT